MNHPAKYWIKYLLSTGQHAVEQIESIMDMYDLGGATREYITELSDELEEGKPIPFRPRTKSHRASQLYLRNQGIYKAWYRDYNMEVALEVTRTPRVRALVEMFILSPVRPEQAVAKILDKEPQSNLTLGGYSLFKYYFWNSSLMSTADLGEYVKSRDVGHREWLKLAVNARGPEGTRLLLWKSGVGALKNLDRAKIFTDFRNIAYMKAKELESVPASTEDSKALLNYTRVAKVAQDEVNNSADAVNDILDGFNAFKMRRKNLGAESVKQLTGGDYTSAEDITSVRDEIEY